MKTFSQICAVIIVTSAIITVASSIRCYHCSTSVEGDKCRYDLHPTDTSYITGNCKYCIKHFYSDSSRIVRKCQKESSSGWSYRSGCIEEYNDGDSYEDCACSDDLCNGASKEKARLFGLLSVCLSVCMLIAFF